ncbi:DinB family protein [Streptomyces fructofermentans]|uniref:Mini-circle protein n=1 Tax=Streptomyces fructofermentans TaxID=152141 RepID=A0A918N7J7_9ACTN|nr:DinB family protein [Streptomyces fructofermentans]GGX44178.1 hypothetical protein GCM10010515_08830 [Streptomyces fructofermentans]
MNSERTDTPGSWDEQTTLAALLDYTRATVHAKCAGLSDADALGAPLPGSPLMTVAGLVSHLRWVEYYWIRVVFLGGEDILPGTEDDPDAEMRIAPGVPLGRLLAEYEAQCADFRVLVAGLDPDDRAKQPISGDRYPTLRWILLHLVEETARHNGHLDILRELADGVTGT